MIMSMQMSFNDVKIKDYYMGYPTKGMVPKDYEYYELHIDNEIIKSIEELSDVHSWLIQNISEYKIDWDTYNFQIRISEQKYSLNIINQYYIRFRYEELAIAFKMRWL